MWSRYKLFILDWKFHSSLILFPTSGIGSVGIGEIWGLGYNLTLEQQA